MSVSLDQLLRAYRGYLAQRMPAGLEARLEAELSRHQRQLARALKAGDTAPPLTLDLGFGPPRSLEALTAEGPTILKFYRGRWCPFCLLELRAWERMQPQLRGLGMRFIAIAAEPPSEIELTRERDGLSFPIVHDANMDIARRFGIAYEPGPVERQMLEQGATPPRLIDGRADWTLASPALYVIGDQRRILNAYVQADFRLRAEPTEILSGLRGRQTA